jgi:hypothetical protein
MPKVLVITANHKGDLELAAELRDIREALGEHSNFTIVHRSEFRFGDVTGCLLAEQPDVLHFAGHGLGGSEQTIILVGDKGHEIHLTRSDLATILGHLSTKPRLLFLNACFSSELGEELKSSVDVVIGAEGKIRDDVARKFARSFYGGLTHSCSIKAAFELAQTESKMAGEDPDQVVINHLPGSDPGELIFHAWPELMAKFVLTRKGIPEIERDHYSIHLWLRGADQNVDSVSYQINHDSYQPKDRYWEINRSESTCFLTDDYTATGDVALRATVWSRDRGVGTQTTLSEALIRYYGDEPDAAIAEAIKVIQEN